jgi:hypothetical protein
MRTLKERAFNFSEEMKKPAMTQEELEELASRPPVLGMALLIVLLVLAIVVTSLVCFRPNKIGVNQRHHTTCISNFNSKA